MKLIRIDDCVQVAADQIIEVQRISDAVRVTTSIGSRWAIPRHGESVFELYDRLIKEINEA